MAGATKAEVFYKAMEDRYRELSGFVPQGASDLGIRLRVLAGELEALSAQIQTAGAGAFPQTAKGEALDLLAEARGLSRRPAGLAGGWLRFGRSTPAPADIAIPAGTLAGGPGGLHYRTTEGATLKGGETEVRVPAGALSPGEAGNAPAGSVGVMISALPGISTVTNPAPFAGGSAGEGDQSLRARLLARMTDPPASFNAAFYREAALAYPGVGSVQVVPMGRGIGTVDVYIAALPGFSAADLAESLGAVLTRAREIGTDLRVLSASSHPIEVACIIRTARGAASSEVVGRAQTVLGESLAALEVGQGLAIAGLSGAVMGIAGVENLRFVSPERDIPAVLGRVILPASIQVIEGTAGMPEVGAL